MSKTKTGGPAFPALPITRESNGELIYQSAGLTMRDYFAAKAMTQFIHEVFSENLADHGYDSVACHAYRTADAMLKAREQ